ncbi:arrestin [Dothidotthia symphoricarpi CBS 119687]|uniref:Arrestin n=1 Tax=Dothidotthia symphoricarpi CBS 119687 TaxID=1392245 RepID=A0A6A6ABB8_9PLEO|nr:arrestin [Dothidotthia symphoricarpi CBS 119687]KAF2128157.1 arrestin [Dothidotthia symphoricarpi CBS 119687]
MQSVSNHIGCKVRHFGSHGPNIEINLAETDGPRRTWTTSYSTMDTIAGTVDITSTQSIRFEDIDVAFIGTSQVFVDRLSNTPSVTGRTEATHRFLALRQPFKESDFPSPRVFEAGKTYKFPFTFTIPAQLLPKACPHDVVSDHVRDCHLMPPPSLGDPDLAGFGGSLLDDFAPEMSKITYGIKVRIAHQRGADNTISILGEKLKKIRVKPAFEEQPPLNIDGIDEYRSRQEKVVRKGLFKGKLGTLTAQTMQPKALRVPGARTCDNEPITTMAKLVLRFDPLEESYAPPNLGSLTPKLKVSTHYASAPRQSLPSRDSLAYDLTQGVYSESIALSNLCIASAHWEKHSYASNPITSSPFRRDSGISDCSTASISEPAFASGILHPSKAYKQGAFYSAQILIPITIPVTANLIPTFHTCIISRTYTLSLRFSPCTGSNIHLKVPFQVCAAGSDTGIRNARTRSVEETELREAGDLSTLRSGGRASEINESLPEYAAVASAAGRYIAR